MHNSKKTVGVAIIMLILIVSININAYAIEDTVLTQNIANTLNDSTSKSIDVTQNNISDSKKQNTESRWLKQDEIDESVDTLQKDSNKNSKIENAEMSDKDTSNIEKINDTNATKDNSTNIKNIEKETQVQEYDLKCGHLKFTPITNGVKCEYNLLRLPKYDRYTIIAYEDDSTIEYTSGESSSGYILKGYKYSTGLKGSKTIKNLHADTNYSILIWGETNNTKAYLQDISNAFKTPKSNSIKKYKSFDSCSLAIQKQLLDQKIMRDYYYVKLSSKTKKEFCKKTHKYETDPYIQKFLESHKKGHQYWYFQTDNVLDYKICPISIKKFSDGKYVLIEATNNFSSAKKKEFEKIKCWIEKSAKKCKGKSKLEKIKMLNKYVMASCSYDYNNTTNCRHQASGVIVHKKAVCDGYAYAFQLACLRNGIPCECVRNKQYTWNIVKYDKKWYHVDTCWNDSMRNSKYILMRDNNSMKYIRMHTIWSRDHERILRTRPIVKIRKIY